MSFPTSYSAHKDIMKDNFMSPAGEKGGEGGVRGGEIDLVKEKNSEAEEKTKGFDYSFAGIRERGIFLRGH